MNRNVVLTCATGYSPEMLIPFLKSISLSKIDAEIIIFRDVTDTPMTLSPAEIGDVKFSVQTCHTSAIQRAKRTSYMRRCANVALRMFKILPFGARSLFLRWLHIHMVRHLFYHEFLLAHPEVECILLCDCRDLVMQADPFPYVDSSDTLIVAEEDMDFGTEANNMYWLRRVEKAFSIDEHLMTSPVVCAGVTLGGRSAILAYTEAMVNSSIRAMPLTRTDGGYDQTFTNILARTPGGLKGLKIQPHGRLPILHVGARWREFCRWDRDLGLVTHTGEVIPVVHQYDRRPSLVGRFSERLGVKCETHPAFVNYVDPEENILLAK